MICGAKFDSGEIILDQRMLKSLEPKTVTGYGLCSVDEKRYKDGFVAVVGVDPIKSRMGRGGETLKAEDAYRTGNVAHVRASAWSKLFNVPAPETADGSLRPFVFADDEVVMGLAGMIGSATPSETA